MMVGGGKPVLADSGTLTCVNRSLRHHHCLISFFPSGAAFNSDTLFECFLNPFFLSPFSFLKAISSVYPSLILSIFSLSFLVCLLENRGNCRGWRWSKKSHGGYFLYQKSWMEHGIWVPYFLWLAPLLCLAPPPSFGKKSQFNFAFHFFFHYKYTVFHSISLSF